MISLFAQLFLALQEHITTNVPEILYIDQDLGQLDWYETRPSVVFPCLLIDFSQASYSNEGNGCQWADIDIAFRLGFSPFTSANSAAPDIAKEEALKFYEIENKLYEALQGFTAEGAVQPLVRLRSGTERRDDPFRVRAMTFTTGTEDDTAQPVNAIVQAGLDLETEV